MRERLIAPKGKFRLIGVDTFEGPFADYVVGDFDSRQAAIALGTKLAGEMKPHYVYSDTGELIFSAGSP